jgi:hypothetical protein
VCPNQITLAPQACSASTTTSSGCQQCWGSSDCCADFQAGAYSDPTCKSSGEPNCPSDTLCRGGNCPATVACDYEGSEELCTQGSKCWGRLTCTGGPAGCPPGYEEGQFCFQAGGSQQFKVCCDTLPTPPEAPAPAPEPEPEPEPAPAPAPEPEPAPAPGEHAIRAPAGYTRAEGHHLLFYAPEQLHVRSRTY